MFMEKIKSQRNKQKLALSHHFEVFKRPVLHARALLLHQLVEQGISGRVFPENSLESVNCKEGVDVGVTFDYVADEAYLLVFDGEV